LVVEAAVWAGVEVGRNEEAAKAKVAERVRIPRDDSFIVFSLAEEYGGGWRKVPGDLRAGR
jgi:hypothetical protein